MRNVLVAALVVVLPSCGHVAGSMRAAESPRLPNVVIVFADDMGWGDTRLQGAKGYETPHLDALAAEGVRFTDFYVAQPVCSASRAALLTGCYPNRIGIHGALGPRARHGLADEETTLAELCKQKGYGTAIFGKWHLGHHPRFLPTRHGFDRFQGIPYSNDMWPYHPESPKAWGDLPTFDQEEIVGYNTDQTRFTTDFTKRAVDFIEEMGDRPFFLYVPHPMPHVPLFVSDRFKGKTKRGLFGDVISEIDWSVGQIDAALRRVGVRDDTIFIFTSDNGPWLSYGDHAGSAGRYREGKGTTFDGGVRVPFMARWPGRIPAGSVCTEPAMTIDLFPTIARALGASLPDRRIDGRDITDLLRGVPGAKSPQTAYFFYYHRNQLQAIRSGRWKLHFPHKYRTMRGRALGSGGKPGKYDHGAETGLELYDLVADPEERRDVSGDNPEVMRHLQALADVARRDLGDATRKMPGPGRREPGRLPPQKK